MGCIIDLVEKCEVIICKGVWYSYNGENIVQGWDNVMKYLEENFEIVVIID